MMDWLIGIIIGTCLAVSFKSWYKGNSKRSKERQKQYKKAIKAAEDIEIAVNKAIQMAEDIGAAEIIEVLKPITANKEV